MIATISMNFEFRPRLVLLRILFNMALSCVDFNDVVDTLVFATLVQMESCK